MFISVNLTATQVSSSAWAVIMTSNGLLSCHVAEDENGGQVVGDGHLSVPDFDTVKPGVVFSFAGVSYEPLGAHGHPSFPLIYAPSSSSQRPTWYTEHHIHHHTDTVEFLSPWEIRTKNSNFQHILTRVTKVEVMYLEDHRIRFTSDAFQIEQSINDLSN